MKQLELFPCGDVGQPPTMPEPAAHLDTTKLFTEDQLYVFGYEAYRRGHADCSAGIVPQPPFQGVRSEVPQPQ